MATLKIDPITTQSRGGYRVVLTGIDPTAHDCIAGEYWTKVEGPIAGQWDLSGYLRGGTDNLNLDTGDNDFAGVVALAEHLGAKR